MEYQRYEGESDEELIYRVCLEKDIIGTWEEVTNILNNILGYEYGRSKYRKQFQYFQKMLKANQSKFTDINSRIEENDALLKKITKERIKLQATKLSEHRYDTHDSRFELFYENLSVAIKNLEPPTLKIEYNDYSEYEYVLGMGDIHYGATFKSENNEYSRDECKRRFGKLLGELENFITQEKVSSLKIINVADTIQGILRFTDLQINDIPIVDCVVEISRILAEFLNQLSAYCPITYYHVPQANHTQIRPLGSKASEIVTEDLEHIIIGYVSDLLIKNSRVNVISNLSNSYVDFKIFNFDCFAMHGHQIKNIKDVIKDMSNRNHKFYSYAFLGHTHSANEIILGEENSNNKEVLTIPAFIGSDPYADSLFVGSKAMAKLYAFDEKFGRIMSKNIILN